MKIFPAQHRAGMINIVKKIIGHFNAFFGGDMMINDNGFGGFFDDFRHYFRRISEIKKINLFTFYVFGEKKRIVVFRSAIFRAVAKHSPCRPSGAESVGTFLVVKNDYFFITH